MTEDEFNHVSDIFERLDADARLQPVGDEAMNVTSTEGLAKARAEVNAAISDRVVTAAELSRRTGIKQAATSSSTTSISPRGRPRGRTGCHQRRDGSRPWTPFPVTASTPP